MSAGVDAGLDWMGRAACRGRTRVMFATALGVLTNGSRVRPEVFGSALRVCESCPVLGDCRRWVEGDPPMWESDAVVAGLTPLDRRALPEPWGRAPESDGCGGLRGGLGGHIRHRRAGERPCSACRASMATYMRDYRARREATA